MNVRRSVRGLCAAFVLVGPASLIATAGAVQATATEPASSTAKQEVVPLVEPSIVYETITFSGLVYDPLLDDGEYLANEKQFSVTFQCSGFVVNSDGWIATAGHCVDMEGGKRSLAEKAAQWAIDTSFYSGTYSVDELADSYRVDLWNAQEGTLKKNTASRGIEASWSQTVSGTTVKKQAPARLMASQKFELGDAALLKVEAQGLNALPLADGDKPAINSDVVTVGYPAVIASYTDDDLVPTFNPGTISSSKTVAHGLLSVLQLSAGMSGGMSGGPTVNLAGEVVGINSSGYDGETINYAVPVERINELMADKGVLNNLSSTTSDYRAGVRAFFAEDKETAVDLLGEVVGVQPGNALAADYLRQAEDLPDPAPKPAESGTSPSAPVLLVGVVGGLITALAGGIVLLAKRSRRNRSTQTRQPNTANLDAPQEEAAVTTPGRPQATPVPAASTAGWIPGAQAPAMSPYNHPVGFTAGPETTPLATASPAAYCVHCGSGAGPGSSFCSTCGSSLQH